MKVNFSFRKIDKKRRNKKHSIKELRQLLFVDQTPFLVVVEVVVGVVVAEVKLNYY